MTFRELRVWGLRGAIALVVFGAPLWGIPEAWGQSSPNIVFVVSDDHGWADVGFRGSVIDTPNIDSLAAEGVTLERYHTQPICGPTRVGIMTGRNPIRIGITGNIETGEDGVPLTEHFLPETFRAAGYQTWALGKWHLGGTTSAAYLPQNRGFDHFYGFLGGSINESTHMVPSTTTLDWQRNGTGVPEDDGQLSTDLLATEAISLIENRDPDRPFLLYLAFHGVHTPYDAPQSIKDKYAGLGLTGQQLQYSAMMENVDINIGRVLEKLADEGIENDTIVVFTSDNGADDAKGGSNLPMRGWKGEVFEGGVRTPAVIRWPGVIASGQSSEQFISHVDWLPTLATAAGVQRQNRLALDGKDRWSAILGGESGQPRGYVIVRGQRTAVIDANWKIVRETSGDPYQLYDLYIDPYETTDLAAMYPAVVTELAAYVSLIAVDGDADFVSNDTDVCTTVSSIQYPSEPADQNPDGLRLLLGRLDQPAGEQKLSAKGYFNPASLTPTVDPVTNGVRIHVSDEAGEIFDLSIPGGLAGSSPCDASDGWQIAGTVAAPRWTYINRSNGLPDGLGGCIAGAANGISKIQIKDQTTGSRQAFQFRLMARDTTLTALPATPLSKIQFDFVLGATTAPAMSSGQASAGQCAEFLIEGDPVPGASPKPYCKISPSDGPLRTVSCSGA